MGCENSAGESFHHTAMMTLITEERPTEEVQLECGGWSLAKLGLFQGEVKEKLTFRGLRDHDS